MSKKSTTFAAKIKELTEEGLTCPTWEVKNILVNEPEEEQDEGEEND